VHTQAFPLSPDEKRFYDALLDYLRDGYNLAQQSGNQGRTLGFVMTIFQKISASSFAAVAKTLRRRLLSLTIHESVVCDENLDADGRERALRDARALLREMHDLSDDALGRAEADRLLADAKVKLLRKLGEKVPTLEADSEIQAAGDEESAAMLVSMALPAERQRIVDLLRLIPPGQESKSRELLRALGDLWAVHSDEKIVVFTTYLGSVDALKQAIEEQFPGRGVDVLKGGDHGAKVAAERRFKRPDGPRVLICTAAGREGINLQFARVLFNHDLPWNPMDVEQRIGRIHRYGQQHTAQVYNLVSAETIEGQIFLLLEEKLLEIGKALGKVDEYGQVAEDLRGQILGQLSEKLSYDKLYQDAVRDPTLVRTRQELEIAVENATTARKVVWELFQDLEDFRLDEYREFDDGGKGLQRLLEYFQAGVRHAGGQIIPDGDSRFRVTLDGQPEVRLTLDRDDAKQAEDLTLLGLEHPVVRELMRKHSLLTADERAVAGRLRSHEGVAGVLSFWNVQIHGAGGRYLQRVVPLGIDATAERSPLLERQCEVIRYLEATEPAEMSPDERSRFVKHVFPEMLRRELEHKGLLTDGASFSSKLLAWIEFVGQTVTNERISN